MAISSGRSKAAAAVCETAFNMATSGAHPAMTMFWLKTRQGWREMGNEPAQGGAGTKTIYSTTFTSDGNLIQQIMREELGCSSPETQ